MGRYNPTQKSIRTNESNGVPANYSSMTANGATFPIQKGQLNKLRIRPQILNEHAESSREVQGIVTSGNIVGQIFKASHDNINGLNLVMESAAGVVFDDFESYADDAALQAVWIATGELADVETSVVYEGVQSMYMPAGIGSTGDEWAKSFTSTNFTDYTGEFWMYSNKEYKDVKMRVFVEDSAGNTSSRQIVQANKDLWTNIIVPVASLIEDVVGSPADITDIVKIGYRVEKEKNDGFVIVDILVSVPPPGSVKLKLFDMGSTLPGSVSLDSGTQYDYLGDLGIGGQQVSEITVDLLGGIRTYHCDDFIAGVALEIPGNQLLTVGNYYAITINYVDTDTSIYGPNTSYEINYYENGYAFTADDESDPITAIGTYSDIMFGVFSTQDVYLLEYGQVADAEPNGESSTTVYAEDKNMIRQTVILSGIKAVRLMDIDLSINPPFVEKGSKIEQEYNDDFTDEVTEISIGIRYKFIPEETNG